MTMHRITSSNTSRCAKAIVDAGFAEADLILEDDFSTQQVEHAYLEPEAGIAYVDRDDVVVVISPSQNITHHRHMLAEIIAKPINKVRFIMSPVGGGFGGKEDMIYQGMLAAVRDEDASARAAELHTRRKHYRFRQTAPIAHVHYKMGLKSEGRITAIEFNMLSDGGAYGMSSEGVMRKAAILSCGPYEVHNLSVDTTAVYTNNTPSGAFRTFGGMQAQFATESMMDMAAEALEMDPFEIRRVNMMKIGAKTHTQHKLDGGLTGSLPGRSRNRIPLGKRDTKCAG